MEHILEETVSSEDLKKFEQKYHEELNHGKVKFTRYDCFEVQRLEPFLVGECHFPV